MTSLLHLSIALAYVIVAGAVAVGLPQSVLGIDTATAVLIALVGGLAGGVVHLTVAHVLAGQRLARLASGQRELRKAFAEIHRALADADPATLRHALAGAAEEIAAEFRVERLLHDQIAPDEAAPKPGEEVLELGDEMLEIDPPPARGDARSEPRLGLDRDEFLRDVGRADLEMGAMPDDGAPRTDAGTAPVEMMSELRREFIEPAPDGEKLLTETQEALKEGRISVFLQPVVALPTRKVAFYESYSRIRASDGTLIGPEEYIPIAEEEGLVSAIDNNLLFRCVQLVRKTRQHNRGYRFFCNISPHTLRDRSFFPQFIEFMNENEDLADALIFELAQDDLANIDAEVELNLKALAAVGFEFSMDRVSSLDLDYADLARRHFSYVKIEAAILRALIGDDDEAVELELLQARLNRAGIELVLEKVETEEALVDFLDFPIAYGQGYLFGEPRLSKLAA